MRPRLACLLAALALLALVAGGCGGGSTPAKGTMPVGKTDSSWVPGQKPLSSLSGFAALLNRAEAAGNARHAAFEAELKRIAAERRAALLRARREALRKYREAKKRAERLYKQALEKAADNRAKQHEILRAAKIERERLLRELLKKLRVKPGEECSLPEVREEFECKSGRLPFEGSLK